MCEAVAVTATRMGPRIRGEPVARIMALGAICSEQAQVKCRVAVTGDAGRGESHIDPVGMTAHAWQTGMATRKGESTVIEICRQPP